MNRSAIVIKMLNYLKANDIVDRTTLANYLECNIRNVGEYKKELEIAGYYIESIPGKNGGYRLEETSLLPSLQLTQKEMSSLIGAQNVLTKANFLDMESFHAAMIKIKSQNKEEVTLENVHYLGSFLRSKEDASLISLFREAVDACHYVAFQYKSLYAKKFEERKVQPYEIINTQEGSYALCFDLSSSKQKKYKFFKLSSFRMKEAKQMDATFLRDVWFQLKDHVGLQSLIQDSYDVQLLVSGAQAILLYESQIGLFSKKEWQEDKLYVSFQMENKAQVVSFILSLGSDCLVLSPPEIVVALKQQLQGLLKKYESNQSKIWYTKEDETNK